MKQDAKNIKILLVDDHAIVREGIQSALKMKKNFEIIGAADSGRSAIEIALLKCPDVVIMDISMPDLNGIETTKRILADNPKVKVIALSMHAEKIFVMGMLDAGASGYLVKSCAFEELTDAIKIVFSGKKYLCPEITELVIKNSLDSTGQKKESLLSKLSQREREILQLISEGNKNDIIAGKLHISKKTVNIHRTNLKKKLNMYSVAELTRFAISEGVTSFEF